MSKSNFKYLILFSLLVWVPATMASFYVFDSLPTELDIFRENQLSGGISVLGNAMGIAGIVTLAANVGLFFFKSWARTIFTAGIFITAIGMIEFGPVIYTGIESAIYELALVLDGIIIGIMYFSPISNEFTNQETHNQSIKADEK